MNFFLKKNILIGVTGGIAAYKIPWLIREIKQLGANVRVVMTESAKQFVTPTTLQALSGNPVHDNLFDSIQEASMGHIHLARWADIIVIAPATANLLSRLAYGNADDLLTTLCLATQAPLFVAPAMNHLMWSHPATQTSVQILKSRNVNILPVGHGEQACGDFGEGRMLEPKEIIEYLIGINKPRRLEGKKIVITAGPTQEWIDPVRYVSNPSTGTMGYAIASSAEIEGAEVVLISGPTHLEPPKNVLTIFVQSALEMHQAVFSHIPGADIFIATAAVSDYRPSKVLDKKFKKSNHQNMEINWIENPDILKSVSMMPNRPFCVGFAAETENLIPYAIEKMKTKKLDMICANDVSNPTVGFGEFENALDVITPDEIYHLSKQKKDTLAKEVIQLIVQQFMKVSQNESSH